MEKLTQSNLILVVNQKKNVWLFIKAGIAGLWFPVFIAHTKCFLILTCNMTSGISLQHTWK